MYFPSLKYEKDLAKEGYRFIACIDEAGRGPLAGPVVAAAVTINPKFRILPPFADPPLAENPKQFLNSKFKCSKRFWILDFGHLDLFRISDLRFGILLKEVRDSKKLSPKKREELYKIIIKNPLIKWGIGIVSEKVIDKINIFQATKLAMKKAVRNLERKFKNEKSPIFCDRRKEVIIDFLILDGKMKLDNLDISQKSIVKADEKVFSCACASIIAKVTRDRIMRDYHRIYPQWRFDLHKGYGTKLHFRLLKNFGPCPIHRKSFRPMKFAYPKKNYEL